MTALASAPAATLRPVPWRRLAWVTWRRYRFTLAATAGVLAVLAVTWSSRASTCDRRTTPCRPARRRRRPSAGSWTSSSTTSTARPASSARCCCSCPGILGAFAGAPLLARELETGTFRYAWTQGVGRMRWAVSLLVPGAVGVAVIMAAFGALVSWHQQPLVDYGARSRLEPSTFPTTGLAVAGWALLGFALGALAGLLWRRVLPALATAFAALVRARVPRATYLRNRLPRTADDHQPATVAANLFVAQWWTKGGVRVSEAEINRSLESLGARSAAAGAGARQPGRGRPDPVPAPARLPAGHQLPAGQPLLDLPVDRVRLAHRAGADPARADLLAAAPGPA